MSAEPGATEPSFTEVRAAFEACAELDVAARDVHLAGVPGDVARHVRELLSIADREARAEDSHAEQRVLDADGRGLVLVDPVRDVVTKLFRIDPARTQDYVAALEQRREIGDALEVHGVLAVLGGGVTRTDVAWFETRRLRGVLPLSDAAGEADATSRATLRTAVAAAMESLHRVVPDMPWPGPRQVLVDGGGRVHVSDPGLSSAFAIDPTSGARPDPRETMHATLAVLGCAARTTDAAAAIASLRAGA